MNKKDNIKLFALSNIDDEIIDESTKKRITLLSKSKRKPKVFAIIAAAAVVAILMASMLVIFIPMLTGKQIPVYTGMTVSGTSPVTEVAESPEDYVAVIADGGGIRIEPVDREMLALYGSRHGELDHAEPFPDGTEDIVDKIESTLSVSGVSQEIYYAKANEDIFITVHVSNPDDFEILSFTLNGKKYASYMFEQGSNMENLILKYNVGDATGIIEYTLDEIKYVDGVEIKDVILEGDRTVKVGIYTSDQPTVSVSNMNVGLSSVSLDLTLTDTMELIALSGGRVQAVLYDGENIIASKDISLGETSVSFDGLSPNTSYQLAIVAVYDALDGQGVTAKVLYEKIFDTSAAVCIKSKGITYTDIEFSYIWDESVENGVITEAALYLGDTKVRELGLEETAIGGLLSGKEYTIVVKYLFEEKNEVYEYNFTTRAKTKPEYFIGSFRNTQTSLSFKITETDVDNIGEITKVELIRKGDEPILGEVKLDEAILFSNLLSGNTYTARITYTFDLNDGNGVQTGIAEEMLYTNEKQKPYVDIYVWDVTSTGMFVDANLYNNLDNVGSITKIELLTNEDQVVHTTTETKFWIDNLQPMTEYKVRVTYSYDLNDGRGIKTGRRTSRVTTLAREVTITDVAITDDGNDTWGLRINVENPDDILIKHFIVNGVSLSASLNEEGGYYTVENTLILGNAWEYLEFSGIKYTLSDTDDLTQNLSYTYTR
ncbi:MAG: hypothetical protein IJ011_04405 [Clostridia bacterium]|nr:hypothetical protein [Clostridia bacterium]